MFDNFLPIPDAESLPFYPLVLKLAVCDRRLLLWQQIFSRPVDQWSVWKGMWCRARRTQLSLEGKFAFKAALRLNKVHRMELMGGG